MKCDVISSVGYFFRGSTIRPGKQERGKKNKEKNGEKKCDHNDMGCVSHCV